MCVVVPLPPITQRAPVLEVARTEADLRGRELHVLDYLRTSADELQIEAWRTRSSDERALVTLFHDLGMPPPSDSERLVPRTGQEPLAHELLTYATSVGAELLVIALRQRTAVGKLLLGSDSQSILLHADCPVLTVPVGR